MRTMSSTVLLCALFALTSCGGGSGTDGGGEDPTPNGATILAEAAQSGAFGMRVHFNPNLVGTTAVFLPIAWVQDDSPDASPFHFGSCWINTANFDYTAPANPLEDVVVVRGMDATSNPLFEISVRGTGELKISARKGDTTIEVSLPGTQDSVSLNYTEIKWKYDTQKSTFAAGTNGGINDAAGLDALNSGAFRVDAVQMGILGGDVELTSSGFMDFDNFRGTTGLNTFALGTNPCIAPDGVVPGTPEFLPFECALNGDVTNQYQVIDGLPPGTTIQCEPVHRDFGCNAATCEFPGGDLGGTASINDHGLALRMTGTGDLAGFTRLIDLVAQCEIHAGPRVAGDPVQTFPTDVFALQADLQVPDPDFAQLQIIAGTGFGLPSPGSTTLTRLPSGNWNVDSFFDISYQIDFVGAPGGALDGLSGSTIGALRLTMTENPMIFADGFESGDVSAWSSSVSP